MHKVATWAPSVLVAAMSGTIALGFASLERPAPVFDDALFFRRVANNLLHVRFAGWNEEDGPVFVNTSQLFQVITTGILALTDTFYNLALLLWNAACLIFVYFLLGRGLRLSSHERLLLALWLGFPSVLLTIVSGMETATVLALMSVVAGLWVGTWLKPRGKPALPLMGLHLAVQLAVFLARPDAILMSFAGSTWLLVRRDWRSGAAFVVATLAALGLILMTCNAYYGTPLPLATYLKLVDNTIYDADYVALGDADEARNRRQVALIFAAVFPFACVRRDQLNALLVLLPLLFWAFHASSTIEIMGYHARYYAPGLPLLYAAGLRGFAALPGNPRRRWTWTYSTWLVAAFTWWYQQDLLENTSGYVHSRVPWQLYVPALLAPLLALEIRRLSTTAQRAAAAGVVVTAAALLIPTSFPLRSYRPADDLELYTLDATHTAAFVGLLQVKQCLPADVTLTHSELGLPGVLLPKARIIDFTGLANPQVVKNEFNFEQTCLKDAPEAIFRPHRTHARLNAQLDESPCLKANYVKVPEKRYTSSPLYIRSDLWPTFMLCSADDFAAVGS